MTSDSANTVHIELMEVLLPEAASSQSSAGRRESVFAMISRKRPVPAEHLSFMTKSLTAPSSTAISLVSWPPMSMIRRFSAPKMWQAPRPWQVISVTHLSA